MLKSLKKQQTHMLKIKMPVVRIELFFFIRDPLIEMFASLTEANYYGVC